MALYVFDTSAFIIIGHYYPDQFPTFWSRFTEAVERGEIVSVRDVAGTEDPSNTSVARGLDQGELGDLPRAHRSRDLIRRANFSGAAFPDARKREGRARWKAGSRSIRDRRGKDPRRHRRYRRDKEAERVSDPECMRALRHPVPKRRGIPNRRGVAFLETSIRRCVSVGRSDL